MLSPEKREVVWDEEGVIFLIYKDGKVLLEERSRSDPKFPGFLLIPGGTMEKGETSQETLNRETKEEFGKGFEIVECVPLVSFLHFDGRGKLLKSHAFLIRDYKGPVTNEEPDRTIHIWLPIKIAYDSVPLGSSKLVIARAVEVISGEGLSRG